MALFRRGKRDDQAPESAQAVSPQATESASDAAPSDAAGPIEQGADLGVQQAEPAPRVTISVSTYGDQAVPASVPAPTADEAQPAADGPGMPENALLRAALKALPEKPEVADMMNVMRQLLQGILYLRVRGDARAILAEGGDLAFATSTYGDNRFLLAFSGPEALTASVAADGDTGTSALGQPAQRVLQTVVEGPYSGVILDGAVERARIIVPKALIEKALGEGDPALTLKNLLMHERGPKTTADVADALTRVPLWVAASAPDGDGRVGVSESRSANGERRLEVYSHPLEIVALGRGNRPVPLTGAQLGKVLVADAGLTGILIDPGGPWITLDRSDLAAVVALAAE